MATSGKKVAPARRRAGASPVVRRRVTETEETRIGNLSRKRVVVTEETVPEAKAPTASSYFATVGDKGDTEFFSSGCAGMDAALGGGWPLGRVSNVVGDKSSGKTLLAIEACANFARQYPKGRIFYRESEASFDLSYAGALGMPVDRVSFVGRDFAKGRPWKMETVEDFFEDAEQCLDDVGAKTPSLYVLDSLDALSDDAEMKREIGEGSFGGSKPKKMGELFRRLVRRIEEQRMHMMVISQLRDKIGVTFGETKTRSGGKALDFYASHIAWLTELGKIKQTRDKVERVVGVNVRARVKKNKVGLAHREFEYPILFGYGIDDLTANAEWLIEVGAEGRMRELGLSKSGYKISIASVRNKGGERAQELRASLRAALFAEWQAVEQKFLPQSRKY